MTLRARVALLVASPCVLAVVVALALTLDRADTDGARAGAAVNSLSAATSEIAAQSGNRAADSRAFPMSARAGGRRDRRARARADR
jgi:hypothetical protein